MKCTVRSQKSLFQRSCGYIQQAFGWDTVTYEGLRCDVLDLGNVAPVTAASRDLFKEEALNVRPQKQDNTRRQGTNFDFGLACVMTYDALNKFWDKKKEKEAKERKKSGKGSEAAKEAQGWFYATIEDELDGGQLEIENWDLNAHCHILRF
ncbi:hypothetical protein LTR05_008729 [Lithohypha guttulata]|uniref:Uncharacterized protein n=1 Tax=Lithohypha guttulata TaxID=1690604 RepID=A0AAN7QA92_9EURO|nr:hypothetical protein LTR05_008729 [Lithohypha guttulata]